MPKQALYLKYRPQQFEDMIGQEHITRTLQNSIKTGRIRHAYLFSGPRGTGKTTSARLLAYALGSKNMDLIEIDAASHTGVDDVRDLRDKIAFMPAEGQYKVYIIDEVHRFSGSAFDALLKTLEEPPEHAIFVLATTEIDKVPDTIKSRCLQFEFRRVALTEVANRLQIITDAEEINIDRAALELIARHGTGSVRDSISLLDQIVADPHEHITLELAQKILGTTSSENVIKLAEATLKRDMVMGLHMINHAVDSGSDPRQFGQQVVEHLRNVLLAQTSSADLIEASDEMRNLYLQQGQLVSKSALLRAVRAFNNAVNDQRSGWQPQLALELALIESISESIGEGGQFVDAPPSSQSSAPTTSNLEELIDRAIRDRITSGVIPTQINHVPQTSTKPTPVAEPEPEAIIDRSAPPIVPLSQIRSKWAESRQAMKTKSTILHALLDHAEVQSISGNVIILTVKTDVFLERLNTEQNRSLMNFVLSRLHGENLKVRVVLSGNESSITTQIGYVDDPLIASGIEMGADVSELEANDDKSG